MQEMFQGFINVDNIFWGDDVFRWWFYAAIVLILIFEKQKTTKITFAWYSIVFLLCLFSPLCNWIMSIIAPAWQYRARLYSMLPIPCVLAIGSILFIQNTCDICCRKCSEIAVKESTWPSVVKLNMVVGVCILIVFGGTDVYKQDWMQPAQNLEKVPLAVLELKEKLSSQENISVAVPESLSSYIRQVEPKFFTPYGRYVNSLGWELSQTNPTPMSVMKKAGEQSVDYIVVYDNEVNEENFKNNGYEVFDKLTGYIIYKVERVPFIKRTYNNKRQVTKVVYLDSKGNPIENSLGYAAILYEYDWEGNISKESYLGVDGTRIITKEGYSSIIKAYTYFSHQVASEKYLDNNDQPIPVNGCFEIRKAYNKKRLIEEEAYYDEKGQKTCRSDTLYASKRMWYDSFGRLTGEEYYDDVGNKTLCAKGYSSYTLEMNNKGQILQESYFGLDGQPIRISLGYACIVRTFSENGNQTSETYIDEYGNLIAGSRGYAQLKWEYNDANQVIRETYWDTKGEPTILKEGYHGRLFEYDEFGNNVAATFINVYGEETLHLAGFSRAEQEYNNKRELIRESYYAFGKPVALSSGFSTLLRKYDDRGNIIEESYYNEAREPVKRIEGYASIRRKFNENSWMVWEGYFDEKGNAIVCLDGFAAVEKKYNTLGLVVEERYYDVDGQPTICNGGYSIIRRTWDSKKQITTERFYDTEDRIIGEIE